MGVQFGEIIGLKNIVEKWVNRMAEKIGGIIGFRNRVGKAYSGSGSGLRRSLTNLIKPKFLFQKMKS